MRNTEAARRAGSVRHRRVSEANLEHERLGSESTVCSLIPISHAEHRNVPKEHFGAQTEGERSEPEAWALQRRQRSALSELNKPCGTPEPSEKKVSVQRDWGRACPSLAPILKETTPQSPLVTAPPAQGSQRDDGVLPPLCTLRTGAP